MNPLDSNLGTVAQICFSPSWGGLEKATLDWTRRFARAGQASFCVCRRGSELHRRLRAAGLDHEAIRAGNRYVAPRTVARIRRILRERRVDFLFVHSSKDLWNATAAVEVSRTRLLFFNRMINSRIRKKDLFHRMIQGKIEHVITLSELARKGLLATTWIPPERVSVIPDAIDPGEFDATAEEAAAVRRRFGVPDDAFLLVTVGRIDPKKGQRELIEAVAGLARAGLDLYLIVVGTRTRNEHAEYDAALRAFVETEGIVDRVLFAGHHDRVGPFYRAADVFVMPSYHETFGLVLLEAMLFGAAVIATNGGAAPEILDRGKCGLLIEPRSSEAIAAAVEALYRDPEERRRLGRAGRERVRAVYDVDRVTERVVQLLRRLESTDADARPFQRTFVDWLAAPFSRHSGS